MAWRFYRRVRLLPGVHVNLSRSGPSLTLGIRGAHVTVGKRGIRRTVGLPGTGVFYTTQDGWHSGAHTHAPAQVPAAPALPTLASQGRAWFWIAVFLAAMIALSALLVRWNMWF